jgi:serpin B
MIRLAINLDTSIHVLFLVFVSFLMAACGPPITSAVPPISTPGGAASPSTAPTLNSPPLPPAAVALAQSDKPRSMAPAVTESASNILGGGNTTFAFDLYRAIRTNNGNLFYSPYSISIALAMTYAGARNNTERQMADTLHFTLPQAQLHPAFNALDLKLTSTAQANSNFRLNLANSLWGQTGFSFRPEFLDTLAENYGAGLRLVDYVADGNREQARQTINQWVELRTEGKIKELLEKGILSDATRLVLVNAIYFKADWELPFLRGTRNEIFTLPDGSLVNVPMMSRRELTNHAEGADYQAAEIAYQGNRMRMLVLLPAPGQFDAFERSLTFERVDSIRRAMRSSELLLTMPKFQYDASLMLAQTLGPMGMPDAFSAGRADFSGMTGGKDLFIKEVVHKAFVAVDEAGTEAAAATGVVTELLSMPVGMTLDRPFVFIIHDSDTGAILFVGRVLDPRK